MPTWTLCCRLNEPSDCETLRNQRKAPALCSQCLRVFPEEGGLLMEKEAVETGGLWEQESRGWNIQSRCKEMCTKVVSDEVANSRELWFCAPCLSKPLPTVLWVELCPHKNIY